MDNENVRIKVISKENRIVSKEYETAYVYDQKGNVLLKKKVWQPKWSLLKMN